MSDTDVRLTWYAADGSVWEWMDGTQSVTLGRNASGLLFPQVDQRFTDGRSGARWHGPRYKPADISVTLQVGDLAGAAWIDEHGVARRGAEWREVDSAVRRSLHPGRAGKLVCTTHQGTRHIHLIPTDVGDKMDMWPDIRGLIEYDVDFQSESPFWMGEPVTVDFGLTPLESRDYYGGSGPPLYISPGTSSTGQSFVNPGDVDAWPVWELVGPGAFEVGVAGQTTTTAPLGAGERIRIDTARRSITDAAGQPAWDRVTYRDFAPLPAGVSTDLVVTSADRGEGSSVTLSVTPSFLGAY